MIADWRAHWSQFTIGNTNQTFPFGFVMLSTMNDDSNHTCGNKESSLCPYPTLRWGQTANYGYVPNEAMPDTFMAVAVDWGDPDRTHYSTDAHPKYKQPIAARLANAALAVAYGQNVYWTGPIAGYW
jgi:sialate O-acetylesterase